MRSNRVTAQQEANRMGKPREGGKYAEENDRQDFVIEYKKTEFTVSSRSWPKAVDGCKKSNRSRVGGNPRGWCIPQVGWLSG